MMRFPKETTIQYQKIPFDADDYLRRHFVGPLEKKNTVCLDFFANVYGSIRGTSLLEFGGGPTLYAILSAANSVEWIHFADYSASCRSAVQEWLDDEPGAFDWSEYTRYALQRECALQREYVLQQCERQHGEPVSNAEVARRHGLLRERVRRVSECDAWADDPLCGRGLGAYDIVAANFCIEALTADKAEWNALHQNVARLVAPGGWYVTCTLWDVSSFEHNGQTLYCPALSAEDVRAMYAEAGFGITQLEPVKLRDDYGYIMACGKQVRA